MRFIAIMFFGSFVLSMIFSYSSSAALNEAGIFPTLIVLILFIFIGVLFDIIGVATTSAEMKTFNSMAARKVPGAKESIWLIKNAEKVSSFCNDVIGDICGIMSGTTSAVITTELVAQFALSGKITPLWVTGLSAAFTIGGKAIGKTLAVNGSEDVVYMVGRVVHFFKKIFGKGD